MNRRLQLDCGLNRGPPKKLRGCQAKRPAAERMVVRRLCTQTPQRGSRGAAVVIDRGGERECLRMFRLPGTNQEDASRSRLGPPVTNRCHDVGKRSGSARGMRRAAGKTGRPFS
jgi:hypothetical protein